VRLLEEVWLFDYRTRSAIFEKVSPDNCNGKFRQSERGGTRDEGRSGNLEKVTNSGRETCDEDGIVEATFVELPTLGFPSNQAPQRQDADLVKSKP
jgi:hypothetical protein